MLSGLQVATATAKCQAKPSKLCASFKVSNNFKTIAWRLENITELHAEILLVANS